MISSLLFALPAPARAPEKSLYSFLSVSVSYAACGEVTERPMVLAWKAGVVKATGGSNPPLSAIRGFEAERALTRCQKSGQDGRVSECRGGYAGSAVMALTK